MSPIKNTKAYTYEEKNVRGEDLEGCFSRVIKAYNHAECILL